MSPNCLAAPGDCSGINRQRMASLQCKPLWCQFCYSPQRESKMARRRLLTGDERRRLFDPPVQETAIIGHYTLSAEDVELVGRRYGPANRLGLTMSSQSASIAAVLMVRPIRFSMPLYVDGAAIEPSLRSPISRSRGAKRNPSRWQSAKT
ncbi:hypothetical protein CJD35_20535 (plasmid) [Sphingobium xenophagum]|uniref:DUF4158 domain-containing protein n=1 Tax=Sphingobium xenophagum TaxID=121428 RepID=A0A249MZZ5_SPHXE|nr:hypothetical protein CJD35_20535 [Sphingobium xenophagum]